MENICVLLPADDSFCRVYHLLVNFHMLFFALTLVIVVCLSFEFIVSTPHIMMIDDNSSAHHFLLLSNKN